MVCAWYMKTVTSRTTTHRDMCGIRMAYAWHMHGMCMAYAWHVHGICMAYAWHVPVIRMLSMRRLTTSAVRSVAIACAWYSLCMVCTCGEDEEEDDEPYTEGERHEGLLNLGEQAIVHLG